jgi:NADH-quinone oxidoreductase subunit G
MPNILINGDTYNVEDGLTLIQVCDMFNIQIPRFCYHEKLPAVGSCRMCLVEIKGSKKLIPACTTNVAEGMEIITESDPIDSARKIMLELLLVNHPLDCPICDKGGECDLQDETYRYGLDRSYVEGKKRAIEHKNFGPLIDAYMTRCIHCTRCIRFAKEIAGVDDIGAVGRGDHTEVETYVNNSIYSELSGNLADVCPVGALTNSNYAYKARPWELISTHSIDIMDSLGSNIKVDSSPLNVLRILPALNDQVNEEWLGDKSRYVVDALLKQRLDTPMIRKDNVLTPCTWDQAFAEIKTNLLKNNAKDVAVLSGDFVDVETHYAMKKLMSSLNITNLDCRYNNIAFDAKNRGDYLFNSKVVGIDDSDFCLIIGANPRIEVPVLNARIRKRYLKGDYNIALIGQKHDLTYKYDYLGDDSQSLLDILDGKSSIIEKLKKAKKPIMIIGLGVLEELGVENALAICGKIAKSYGFITENHIGVNILHTNTATIGGLDVGFVPLDTKQTPKDTLQEVYKNKIKFLWLLNYDKIDTKEFKHSSDNFVVYQGHHGDIGASIADVILPSTLWLEKNATYVNLEGRVQRAFKCSPALGEAKEDWKIIKKLSQIIKKDLPFNTIEELRQQMQQDHPHLANFHSQDFMKTQTNISILDDVKVEKNLVAFKSVIDNYYVNDIISKNSAKLQEMASLCKVKK